MTARLLVQVGAMLSAGSVVAAGVYWAFLSTPESNVLMLSLSALLFLALALAIAATVNAAVLIASGVPAGAAIRQGVRSAGWFPIALAPLLLGWWAIGRADDWISAHQGEITAWMIARFDWTDITPLLNAELWVSRWLRWALLPLLTLSLLAALLTPQPDRLAPVRRVAHWRPVLTATLVFVLLFALPWQLAEWRPTLPPTWVEPAVAALRLGLVYVLGIAGSAVLIATAATSRR